MNAVAGLMVLTGRRAGMYRRADVHELEVALARECLAVATAEGATPDDAMAERIADQFAGYPPDLGTSIQFDRAAGRPLEWDARNGVIPRLAARHGIATPVSDILVPLLAVASDDPTGVAGAGRSRLPAGRFSWSRRERGAPGLGTGQAGVPVR